MRGALGGPRVLLRRLREVMAEPVSAQERLNKIVVLIAANMVAEVCSVYVLRVDGTLELYATEGLNPESVHVTVMRQDEGLVGIVAAEAKSLNLSDAQHHPAFSFRPETGEEIYHSFLGVPILRAGNTLGVLVVQNRAHRTYSEDEEEALQTTAMVLAETIASGELSALAKPGLEPAAHRPLQLAGLSISDGIGLGHVVLHEPRVVVTKLIADDPQKELQRLDQALNTLRADLDRLLERRDVADGGEHREVLEAYRMFAHDRGWMHKMHEAVTTGLTAEAAVERVQSDNRARMMRQTDPYLRERLHDLDDLASRLMRQLVGRDHAPSREQLPDNAILVARSMGPAALLDYDRKKLRALVLEEGGPTSHVSIVARALGIAAVGQIANATGIVDPGDAIIVDGTMGHVHVRPTADVEKAYADRVRLRARRQAQYAALRDKPCRTKDGEKISLLLNAGLLVDLPHIAETGAAGIGLFRTELQFMVAPSLPRTAEQTSLYRPGARRRRDATGDLPHARYRRRQGAALTCASTRRGESGARLPGDPPRARPAGPAAQPDPRHARCRGRARTAHHVPDGDDGRRVRPGQGSGRTRAHASAPPRPHAARARACRRHGRGAGAALSARRIARARRFPVGRLERSGAVHVRRRPQQHAPRQAASTRSRRRCCARSNASSTRRARRKSR